MKLNVVPDGAFFDDMNTWSSSSSAVGYSTYLCSSCVNGAALSCYFKISYSVLYIFCDQDKWL